MDRLEDMAVLVAAVEAGSFSGASRKLGMPLPTVSRKVAELERHLGTTLLVRTARKLVLTDSGAAYLTACRRILDLVAEAEAQAAGEYVEPRGELMVTAPVAFGRMHVLPVVISFLVAHPQIDVRMVLADRTIDLIDSHIDVGVRIGDLPDSSLVATRIGAVRRIVCGSPAYFAAQGLPESVEDLADHQCVTFAGLPAASAWTLRGADGRPVQAKPRSRLSVDTADAAIDAARAGIGVTRVLSYQAAPAIADGTLVEVLQEFASNPIPVHLVHAGRGLLPLKTRGFLDFAVPRLRKVLA